MLPKKRLLLYGRRALDAEAIAWAAAVTANGGVYSGATLDAFSARMAAKRASGVWAKTVVYNPMCGGASSTDASAAALAAVLIQYKNGVWAAATNTNFVSGDYTEATGLTGNASTKYLRTGLLANTLTLNDTHMTVYNRASSTTGAGRTIGTQNGTDTFIMFAPFTDGNLYSDQYASTGGRASGAAASPYGFLVGSRTASNAHSVYRNGTSIGSIATTAGALPAFEIYVCAVNNGGSALGLVSHPIASYSVGSGLTAGEIASDYTAEQAFHVALNRSV